MLGNDEVTLSRTFGNEKYVLFASQSWVSLAYSFLNSIRMMFSIMDVQAQQENVFSEGEEEGNEDADAAEPSYPVRTSFVITKVWSPITSTEYHQLTSAF